MAYTKHTDGRVTWTRNVKLSRGDSQPARSRFTHKTTSKTPQRNYAKRLGTAKPRAGSRRDLVDRLDREFSRHIRRRDGKCVTCPEARPEQLTCSHFYSRRFYATRWDEVNCACQCFNK